MHISHHQKRTLTFLSPPPGLTVPLTLLPSFEDGMCSRCFPASSSLTDGVWFDQRSYTVAFVYKYQTSPMCWYGPHSWRAHVARCVLAVSLCVPFLQQRQTNQDKSAFYAREQFSKGFLKWQWASIKKIKVLIMGVAGVYKHWSHKCLRHFHTELGQRAFLHCLHKSCPTWWKMLFRTLLWLELLSRVYLTLWRFGSQDLTNKRPQLLVNECNIGPLSQWSGVYSAFWPNSSGYHHSWNIFSCSFSICLLFFHSWESAPCKGCL